MSRRLPIAATVLVAAAVALMIGLGLWQLRRAEWKEGVLARFAAAEKLPPIAYPTGALREDERPLFRHATGVCLQPVGKRAVAGENREGEPGYVQIVDCRTGGNGRGISVEIGWSKNPNVIVNWPGGPVSGVIVPDRKAGIRLVAASAPAGLEPSKVPDASTATRVSPAGHRGYAATWFSLAAIALAIYVLAVRKKLKEARAIDER